MKKRRVVWGKVTLGSRMPAVAVPVMGKDEHELRISTRAAVLAGADVIELRADSFSSMPNPAQALATCEAVRQEAKGVPILFTLRTRRDGGLGDDDAAAYEALLAYVAERRTTEGMPLVEAIDCELSIGEVAFARLAAKIHAAGVSVVGSSHDFLGTPAGAELIARWTDMERLGADVAKIAVMPKARADVLALMEAAMRADEVLSVPLIAIAMGPMGVLTRIGGEAFGSCLTFGAAEQASAPGQLNALALRETLQIVHHALEPESKSYK